MSHVDALNAQIPRLHDAGKRPLITRNCAILPFLHFMSPRHTRLHIPGPVEVSPETYAAMSAPMIGHRGKEFQTLYASMQPGLQSLLETTQPVFLSTSSAWGIMEGAIRNLSLKRVLCCCSGAFSDKWVDVARRCGREADALQFEWGQPIDPSAVQEKLATGLYDTVTLIHNETSTGVLNPVAEIAAVVRQFEEVMLVVDTVSSLSAMPTPAEAWGADVVLAGSQKALALPPGLAIFTVSPRAMERAKSVPGRGYYFDFLEFLSNHEKDMTPSTPCISTIFGLAHTVKKIEAEGIAARHARHAALNALVHEWVTANGFEFFAPEGFRSVSLTCVANNRGIDVAKLTSLLKSKHGLAIDGGYGKIKGKTFRLSNMGDETEATIRHLLACLDDVLPEVC